MFLLTCALSIFQKNIAFPTEGEYPYFSAQLRLDMTFLFWNILSIRVILEPGIRALNARLVLSCCFLVSLPALREKERILYGLVKSYNRSYRNYQWFDMQTRERVFRLVCVPFWTKEYFTAGSTPVTAIVLYLNIVNSKNYILFKISVFRLFLKCC